MSSTNTISFAQGLQPFVCGGFSAMLASSCIHPIDLAKVRLQLFALSNTSRPSPGFVGIIVEMIKKDGIKSIYGNIVLNLKKKNYL
jgi:hypothetical protein